LELNPKTKDNTKATPASDASNDDNSSIDVTDDDFLVEINPEGQKTKDKTQEELCEKEDYTGGLV